MGNTIRHSPDDIVDRKGQQSPKGHHEGMGPELTDTLLSHEVGIKRTLNQLDHGSYNSCMPRRVAVLVCALLTFVARTSTAQDVSRAYCGKDGKAHIVYRDGATRTPATATKQVGCEHITVAKDGRTVGWSVLVDNCCTSYPIPISVVVYRNGKQMVISSDQSVWEWRFIDEGRRVAVLSGPLHGGATAANLYNSHNGRVLATWDGKETAPIWATGWERQFAEHE